MLKHLVRIDAIFVAAGAQRPFDLIIVLARANLNDIADIRERIGSLRVRNSMVPDGILG